MTNVKLQNVSLIIKKKAKKKQRGPQVLAISYTKTQCKWGALLTVLPFVEVDPLFRNLEGFFGECIYFHILFPINIIKFYIIEECNKDPYLLHLAQE